MRLDYAFSYKYSTHEIEIYCRGHERIQLDGELNERQHNLEGH